MSDTTDQQAVTVAQQDRDAAHRLMLAHCGDDWRGLLRGEEDAHSFVQAFARHRLASVSSASAEEAAHLQTIDERDAAEAALSDAYRAVCGKEPAWSNLFGYQDAIEEIREASASPEPVPATNQAGEADMGIPISPQAGEAEAAGRNLYLLQGDNSRMADALRKCRDQFAFYAREHYAAGKSDKGDTNTGFADIATKALEAVKPAALATQPATSQEAKPCSTGKEKGEIAETALGFRGDRTEHGDRESVTGQSSDRLSQEETARANEILDLFAPLSVSSTWEPSERRTIVRAMLAYGDIVAAVTNSERDADSSTSQPEETWMNDPLSLDAGLPATSQGGEDGISDAQINDAIRHGFGDRFADDDQRDRVLAALNNLRVNPSVDEIPLVLSEIMAILQPDVLRDRIAVLERENRNYAKTMDIIGQLPATPTPPTLSEDLLGKVRDVLAIYADPAGYTGNNGEQMTADNAAHPGRLAQLTLVEFDAALAQVKAS